MALSRYSVTKLTACMLLLSPTIASSQSYPEFEVYGEKDDEENTACRASHKSAVATVQAALRNNGLKIGSSSNAMSAYVNIIAVNHSEFCSTSFSLKFQKYQYIDDDFTGKPQFANILICHKYSVVGGSPAHIHNTLLSAFTDYTNQCVSEYLDYVNNKVE